MPIRPATIEDADRIAYIHVRSWQAAYRGLLPDEFLAGLSVERRAEYWHSLLEPGTQVVPVYQHQDQVVGFVAYGPCRDEDIGQDSAHPNQVGEIYAIYLLPDTWGLGYGAALFNEAVTLLRAEGYAQLLLWVLDGNVRAIQFYRNMGLRPDGTTKTEAHPAGVELNEARYRRDI